MGMKIETYNDVDYLPDVEFKAVPARGGQNYLQCDGCHKVTTATALSLPRTLYYDGVHLTARYDTYWFCPDCMKKLREVVRQN